MGHTLKKREKAGTMGKNTKLPSIRNYLLVKTETKVTFSYRKIHSVGLEWRVGQKDRNQSHVRKVPTEIILLIKKKEGQIRGPAFHTIVKE